MSVVLLGLSNTTDEFRDYYSADPYTGNPVREGFEYRSTLELPSATQAGDLLVFWWTNEIIDRRYDLSLFPRNLWNQQHTAAGVRVFQAGDPLRYEGAWKRDSAFYMPRVAVYRGAVGALSALNTAPAEGATAVAPQVVGTPGGELLTFWHASGVSAQLSGSTTPATTAVVASTGSAVRSLTLTGDGLSPLVSQALTASGYWRTGSLVIAGATAPLVPSLSLPSSGARDDLSTVVTFRWQHRKSGTTVAPVCGSQRGFAFRRRVGVGAYEYWDAGAASWSPTVVWNASTVESVTFPAGVWPNGETWSWSVATEESIGGERGVFADDRPVTSQAAPVAVVTAPVGSVATTQPTVEWAGTHPVGAVQTGFEVAVTVVGGDPELEPVYSSGTVASDALSHTVEERLDNLESFEVHVRLRQTGDQWGAWASAAFTTDAATPPAPVLTVTPEPLSEPPMILVGFDESAYESLPGDAAVVCQASDDGGVSWRDLRAVLPAGSSRSFGDVEAQWGAPVRYRARVFYDDAGVEVTSSWAVSRDVTLAPDTSWLIDPLNPAVSVPADLTSDGDLSTDLRTTEYDTLGRAEVVVVSGLPSLPSGQNTAYLQSAAEGEALMRLLTSQRTLLLCLAEETDQRGRKAFPRMQYQRLVGDVQQSRHRLMATQDRLYSWRWVGQSRPTSEVA